MTLQDWPFGRPICAMHVQAADASASQLHTAFEALTHALTSQRQQLDMYASQQQAGSEAMMQHTQSAIALVRQHLSEADAATSRCQGTVTQTLDVQASALIAFDELFANAMQEEQVGALNATHCPT